MLAALGVEADAGREVTQLKHVRSRAEINAAEEVARRTPCEDFDEFRPVFEQVQSEIENGARLTTKYEENAEVARGDLFILDGQKVLIASLGDRFVGDHGREDRRLRVIYDNGTESDLLMRSLQRALNKDPKSRRIRPPELETRPLFSKEMAEEDAQAGFIYVLRSLSSHPFIAEQRDVIHKIGVTGRDVKRRISNAKKDPTFLLADVEIVESYKLANVNRTKLEAVLHNFLAPARIDLQLLDRFSEAVEPREWFLVPLPVIRRTVELLMSGEIEHCRYDLATAQIVDTRTDKPIDTS